MNVNRIYVASTLLIALSLSAAQAGIKKTAAPVPDEARATLKDIQRSSSMIETQADELITISENTAVSPESHLNRLIALKNELNKAGQEINLLESESLAPWERQAIGKTLPLLADAAANTQKAFEYFNENRTRFWTPDYRGFAERVSRDASDASRILKDYSSLAKARDREQELEHRVEVTGE